MGSLRNKNDFDVSLYENKFGQDLMQPYEINKKIVFRKDDKTKEEVILSVYLPKFADLDQRIILEKAKVKIQDPKLFISTRMFHNIFYYDNIEGISFRITYDETSDLFLLSNKYQQLFTTG